MSQIYYQNNFRAIGDKVVPQSRVIVPIVAGTSRASLKFVLELRGEDLTGWLPRIGAPDGPVLRSDDLVADRTEQGRLAIYWWRPTYP